MSASNGAVILPAGPAGLMLPGVVRTTPLDYIAVPDGLWAYWPFDADTIDVNNVQDLGPNAFNFSRSASGAFSGTRVTGQIDGAVSFDGGTTPNGLFVVPTSATLAGATQFSISAWVNLASLTNVNSTDLPVYYESTSTAGLARLGLIVTQTTGIPYLRYRDAPNDPAGSGVNISGSTALVTGRWVHLVATYDSVKGFGGLFVNGVLNVSGTPSNALGTSSTAGINIGGDFLSSGSVSNNYFNGSIDDLRIYKRAISAAEVMQLYVAGIQGRRDAGPRLPAYADLPALFLAGGSTTLSAAKGTFTETGRAITFLENLIASKGTFTETGRSLTFSEALQPAKGTFTETGRALTFLETLNASKGTYTLTGRAATLVVGALISASKGSFTLTGKNVTFAETLNLSKGSFTETGRSAQLIVGAILAASRGTYTLTGKNVTFLETVTAVTGPFHVNGQNAVLVQTGAFGLASRMFMLF